MGSRFIKRLTSGLLPVLLLLILLLVSLHLISGAIQTAPNVNRLYSWLLIFNGFGLITLFALIANRVLRLWRQYRNNTPGSRLTLRMVMLFLLLSLAPVSIVYYYSNRRKRDRGRTQTQQDRPEPAHPCASASDRGNTGAAGTRAGSLHSRTAGPAAR